MYTFKPNANFKYSTKLSDSGESVAALQVNLPVVIDGSFGPITQLAVKNVQTTHNLTVDGVAGPATQRALCLELMHAGYVASRTPTGLLRGICEHESSYFLAAYSVHPSDSGFDLGAFQQSFPPTETSQANYEAAYSVVSMSVSTAAVLRTQKSKFINAPFASTNQRAWELAALYHNWPFAAVNLANTNTIFPDNPAKDNEFAQWVFDASGGALSTPAEWANHYISTVSKYVTDWTS